jgi:hypothetical protein
MSIKLIENVDGRFDERPVPESGLQLRASALRLGRPPIRVAVHGPGVDFMKQFRPYYL